MSVSHFVVRRLILKGLPTYKCDQCGAQAEGQTVSLGHSGHPDSQVNMLVEDLESHVRPRVFNPTNHHMPVGWSCHRNGKHLCPRCGR